MAWFIEGIASLFDYIAGKIDKIGDYAGEIPFVGDSLERLFGSVAGRFYTISSRFNSWDSDYERLWVKVREILPWDTIKSKIVATWDILQHTWDEIVGVADKAVGKFKDYTFEPFRKAYETWKSGVDYFKDKVYPDFVDWVKRDLLRYATWDYLEPIKAFIRDPRGWLVNMCEAIFEEVLDRIFIEDKK